MISQKIEIDVVILKSISIFKITTRIFAFSGAESSFKDTLFEFRSTILQWRTQTYVRQKQKIKPPFRNNEALKRPIKSHYVVY